MSERRRFRHNPYQLPLELARPPEIIEQHVRALREEYVVRSPADAANYLLNQVFSPFEHFRQEHMYVLLMNQRNIITHDVMVYKGTVNTIYIRLAELYREAVRQNSPSILISHCHPSGDPSPSPEDLLVTGKALEAGKLLDIMLIDHIIIGNQCYVSLKEKNMVFT